MLFEQSVKSINCSGSRRWGHL